MNRRPPGLQLSKALQGFLQYKTAEGLSPRTIASMSAGPVPTCAEFRTAHGDHSLARTRAGNTWLGTSRATTNGSLALDAH